MKDNSTGKPKDFYTLGKEIFDQIKVLEKPKNARKLHHLPIQSDRPGQRPPGRQTVMQAQPPEPLCSVDTNRPGHHCPGADDLGNSHRQRCLPPAPANWQAAMIF